MRIRGAKAELEDAELETEGMVESTAQLQKLIKGMTGFDIMQDENTFKDIYEIIVGIGEKWGELEDIEQASLLEKLAGKRQGNALAAALNNIDMIKEAYETAENSAGSALREQENYEKGIGYSLEHLSASFQELSMTVLNSDFLKGMVDSGNTLVNVLDTLIKKFGGISTVLAGIGGIALNKKLGWHIIGQTHC